ncbi:MAG: FecR domain-containing protein [Bacteroides sp.]|nr:FecR domain-containing protein [Bacteroides sp.]
MNIRKTLLRYIVGIHTSKDEEILRLWLSQDERHLRYWEKLQNRRNYVELYADYRQKHPRFILPFWRRTWVRVAVCLLPIAISAALCGLVVTLHPKETITPGRSMATLVLDNGTPVSLGEAKVSGWIHIDDHQMAANEKGTLRYTSNEVAKAKTERTQGQNRLKTPRGGEYRIELSDGTKVRLNALSSLIYPTTFNGDRRMVELEGEAYFEIAKDSLRPFVVKTNGLEIMQYGTKFTVNARSSQATTVVLEEGSIGLSPSGEEEKQLMVPGEVATWSETTSEISVKQSEKEMQQLTAWHNERFIFENETLGKVMETLSMWYDMDVRFQEIDIASLRFTGNLSRYADIEVILQAVEHAAPITIKMEGKQIMIMQRK